MRLYEGMFVVDSAIAERSYDEVCDEIRSTISKHGGEVVDLRKWDERRLAYEIKRVRRGVYVLVHFEAPPEAMEEMRRDFVLSDNILRQMLLVDIDGVPSGEERPGITNSISEASHRRRHKPREDSDKGEEADDVEAEDGGNADVDEPDDLKDTEDTQEDDGEQVGEPQDDQELTERDE